MDLSLSIVKVIRDKDLLVRMPWQQYMILELIYTLDF